MAIKKRRRVAVKGAGNTAPSGGIKRRKSVPEEELDSLNLPGELGARIEKITKSGEYGNPFILGSSRRLNMERVPTGILSLDLGLGGGWTTSRTHMLYGEKSSGKSTIALQSIATNQIAFPDSYSVWVDVEGTLDKAWARKLGVNIERLIVVEPESGEHAVDLADEMLRAKEVSTVVTDSIAMIVPMKEIEESSSQDTMALQARLMGKYLRRANNAIIKERGRGHKPTLININQFRMKVGLVFGDPRTLPGGKILEFATTQQVEVKNKEHFVKDDDGNQVVGFNEHNTKITKNKGGGPMKEGAFKLIRLDGFEDLREAWVDQSKTIYKYGMQAGIIKGAPSSYEIEDIGKFRGGTAFNRWAMENPVEYAVLQQRIISYFRKRWDLD